MNARPKQADNAEEMFRLLVTRSDCAGYDQLLFTRLLLVFADQAKLKASGGHGSRHQLNYEIVEVQVPMKPYSTHLILDKLEPEQPRTVKHQIPDGFTKMCEALKENDAKLNGVLFDASSPSQAQEDLLKIRAEYTRMRF